MIENFDKKSNWYEKYIPNVRIIRLIDARQLEGSDLTGRLQNMNIIDVHKILPSDFIISLIPDD